MTLDLAIGNLITPGPIETLANRQIETYLRQPEELISHYNREIRALDGYRGRQILELLQNADDAGVDSEEGCALLFHLTRDRLVVANTGKAFSEKGLIALVISDCSPKQLGRGIYIGSKGLGFRSILTWTDCPMISSGPYEVMFDRAIALGDVTRLAAENPVIEAVVGPFLETTRNIPAAILRFPRVPPDENPWLRIAREFRETHWDTVIVLPLPADQRGDEIHREMLEQIRGLSTDSLLFCRHLTKVLIQGDLSKQWDLAREAKGLNHATVILQEAESTELWDVFHAEGVVDGVPPAGVQGGEHRFEVAVAVPGKPSPIPDPTRALCVFFPTTGILPCSLLMHATLETTDDRKHLVNHLGNRKVLERLAIHVADVIEREAKASTPLRALKLISGIENVDSELKSLGFLDALIRECGIRKIFPRVDGNFEDSTKVRHAPSKVWYEELKGGPCPEILTVPPGSKLEPLLARFKLPWYDQATLKARLKAHLLGVGREDAGKILGRLLAANLLNGMKANGMLLGLDGTFIQDSICFFTSTNQLPPLPAWVSNLKFVDKAFQDGLIQGSGATSLRALATDLGKCGCMVEEYGFEPVAQVLIAQVESSLAPNTPEEAKANWRQLLSWLFQASPDRLPSHSNLAIKIVTTRGTLKPAKQCYLGPDYPRGNLVHRLYGFLEKDEFVGSPSDNGLGDLPPENMSEKTQDFLISAGVAAEPRSETLKTPSPEYMMFLDDTMESLSYPRTIREISFKSYETVKSTFRELQIDNVRIPDRLPLLLRDGDAVAVVAYFNSYGTHWLSDEVDRSASFKAQTPAERRFWADASVPIPNATLFFLRHLSWIPSTEERRRPSEIMLSKSIRMLPGIYHGYNMDPKDDLLAPLGGKKTLDPFLVRLGAVYSLEDLDGQAMYELLLGLPKQDPTGKHAPAIYRSLMEAGFTSEDSHAQELFLRNGIMWGSHQGIKSYLPVQKLRYNANLELARPIQKHLSLVDIPTRKSTRVVKSLFGISSLTTQEIQVSLQEDQTILGPYTDEADQHFKKALPFFHALRLAGKVGDGENEIKLLRQASLRVCLQAGVTFTLPAGITETMVLKEPGERIVAGTKMLIVYDYDPKRGGYLTFWLHVAELVAELLGKEVTELAGNVLRCRTDEEMLELVRAKLGEDADERVAEARERFEEALEEDEEEPPKPMPPPKPNPKLDPEPEPEPKPKTEPEPKPTGNKEEPSGNSKDESNNTKDPKGCDDDFEPTDAPSGTPPNKRALVITGLMSGGGGRGPATNELLTLEIVENFERHQGRFTIPVSHLHGIEAFGCDILSVASKTTRDDALVKREVNPADVERFIEVKGKSNRNGDVELTENELNAAEKHGKRFWLYRVFRHPDKPSHYEVAILSDPLRSGALRLVKRFSFVDGSGAEWYRIVEKRESPSGN